METDICQLKTDWSGDTSSIDSLHISHWQFHSQFDVKSLHWSFYFLHTKIWILTYWVRGLWLWCLTPLSTIFQLYSQFYWRKPKKTAELPQVIDKTLSHNAVSSTPRLSGIRTHNVSGDCIGSCKSNYHTKITNASNNLQKWYLNMSVSFTYITLSWNL